MKKLEQYWQYRDTNGEALVYEVLRSGDGEAYIKPIFPEQSSPFMYRTELLERHCRPIKKEDLELFILGEL